MNPELVRDKRIAAFLQLALEEFDPCEQLYASRPRQAAYFLQQAVEKLLRAALEHSGMNAGPTHNIRALCELLPKQHALKEWFLDFDDMSSAATRFRYPSPFGALQEVTSDSIERRLAEMRALDAAVRKHVGKASA